jgi:hypothetical protein
MATNDRPMVREHNTETDEVIDREMTNAELEAYEESKAIAQAAKADAESKESAKAALLVKLGITEDEAKLLLS